MEKKMAMSRKGVRLLLAGLLCADKRRSSDQAIVLPVLEAAPLVIIAGIVMEVVAIMGKFEDKGNK